MSCGLYLLINYDCVILVMLLILHDNQWVTRFEPLPISATQGLELESFFTLFVLTYRKLRFVFYEGCILFCISLTVGKFSFFLLLCCKQVDLIIRLHHPIISH